MEFPLNGISMAATMVCQNYYLHTQKSEIHQHFQIELLIGNVEGEMFVKVVDKGLPFFYRISFL